MVAEDLRISSEQVSVNILTMREPCLGMKNAVGAMYQAWLWDEEFPCCASPPV